jgi:hypothetical protein
MLCEFIYLNLATTVEEGEINGPRPLASLPTSRRAPLNEDAAYPRLV